MFGTMSGTFAMRHEVSPKPLNVSTNVLSPTRGDANVHTSGWLMACLLRFSTT
jgi:hypothetical protein